MTPDISGQTVIRVQLDYGLIIWTDGGWELQLNGDTHRLRGVEDTIVENTASTTELPRDLANLVGQVIDHVAITPSSELEVHFADCMYKVGPDPDGEAWELGGPRGEIVVCRPAGGLESWGPRA